MPKDIELELFQTFTVQVTTVTFMSIVRVVSSIIIYSLSKVYNVTLNDLSKHNIDKRIQNFFKLFHERCL